MRPAPPPPDPFEELRRALRELWEAIVEATRLERLVAWLARRLR